MIRKKPRLRSLRFLLSLVGFCLVSTGLDADQPSHIVLIMTDDQGYGDLGFHGNPIVKTPHLDRLAQNSARLPNFIVSPVCTPTRACLMTGRYNYRTRAIDTYKGRAMMEPDEVTVAEVLSTHGYATGLFGKWHLGDNYPLRPMDQGFDEVLGHRGGGLAQKSDHPENNRRYTDAILLHNGKLFQSDGYCTDVYFDAAIDWINKAHKKSHPSFSYIATNAPHAPWHDVPPKWHEYYQQQTINPETLDLDEGYPNHKERPIDADTLARYYAMISNIDDNVGRLTANLLKIGVLENTLLIFLTDNGPAPNGFTAGLRGKKGRVYEGGIRSPFFVHWPARLSPGEKASQLAAHIDVMPTILDAAGIDPPSDRKIDGRSLMPLLQSTDAPADWPQRSVFIQSHRGNKPVSEHNFCVRTDRWKLLRASGFPNEKPGKKVPLELFDLKTDPFEMNDVADEHPRIVSDMKQQYQTWFEDVSSTRKHNYAPPRITLGTSREPEAVLTRQDRREGNGNDAVGHWLVEIAEAGEYRINVTLIEPARAGTLEITIGNETARRSMEDDEELAFALPAGPCRLTARIVGRNQQTTGVDYVRVRREH
jgi:arylsulfatase/arylsulfatase A